MDEKNLKENVQRLVAMSQGFDHLEKRLENVEVGLNKLASSIEHNLSDKINALYDAYVHNKDQIRDISASMEQLSLQINTLQMETAHIRRVK